MPGWYTHWVDRWETSLANRDTNRLVRPFEWGLDWLDLSGPDEHSVLAGWAESTTADSDSFFAAPASIEYKLSGSDLAFSSTLASPYPENNTVHARYFPSPGSRRAVLVIPQWNSDEESHIGLCRMLQRLGISSLRMSKAYHHRRMPPELARADYHVSSNIGRTIHATRQSVVDARCCLAWLEQRGYQRIGIVGTSLGSCVALLAAAHDTRVRAAVFNHVSLYFSDVVWNGMSCRHIRQSLESHVTESEMRHYWSVISPAPYIERLAGREMQSLLIWAQLDTTFLPDYSREVLRRFATLSLPHQVRTMPCGHYTLGKFPYVWLDGWAICKFLYQIL